jgi:hypothetical protein
MRKIAQHGTWLAAVCLALSALPASATDSEDINYTMRAGDNLITLAKRYLNNPNDYKIVQRHNAIADPIRIPVGRKIKFPRTLLKYKSASAKLLSVRGRVLVGTAGKAQTQAAIGQVLGEGARLATAESSFVTLLLDNGSRLSLPSNSDMQIRLLRSYVLGGSLDYDFDLGKGGTRSSVVPLKSSDDRYRVRTPKAVSAVRGTDFQARFDPETNSDFAEVVEGGLAVELGGLANQDALALPAGNGLAVPKSGKALRETLLPEPALIEPGRMQSDRLVKFTPNLATPAAGYRYTVSTDAGFVDQIADVTTATDPAELSDIGDGNYFLRARAISPAGIQGIPATFTFKRRLNAVTAAGGPSDDGFAFKWIAEGKGISRYHFQLFKGSKDGTAMVDEASLQSDQISLSDLPPGVYFWRVGSVQYQDAEVSTNWTPFEKLSVSAP